MTFTPSSESLTGLTREFDQAIYHLRDQLPEPMRPKVASVIAGIRDQSITVAATERRLGVDTPFPTDAQLIFHPNDNTILLGTVVINPDKFLGLSSTAERAADLARTVFIADTLKPNNPDYAKRLHATYADALSFQNLVLPYLAVPDTGSARNFIPRDGSDRERILKSILGEWYFADVGIEDWRNGLTALAVDPSFMPTARSLRNNIGHFLYDRKRYGLTNFHSARDHLPTIEAMDPGERAKILGSGLAGMSLFTSMSRPTNN